MKFLFMVHLCDMHNRLSERSKTEWTRIQYISFYAKRAMKKKGFHHQHTNKHDFSKAFIADKQ